jgi:hypothetical protein
MLNTLIVAAAPGVVPQQQSEPLFPQLFPAPTGQNALEFYVRAYDFARENNQRVVDAMELQESGATLLALEERYSTRAGEVADLVKKGNRFVCVFPAGDAGIRAHVGAKEIAKVLMQYGQVLFTHGRPNDAVDVLLAAMGMADRISVSGAPLALLVARAVDSISLVDFHYNYNSLPLAAAQQILARVKVPDADLFITYAEERAASIARDLRDKRRWTESDFDATMFEELSDPELAELRAQWSMTSAKAVARMREILTLPESKWTEAKPSLSTPKLMDDPNVAVLFAAFNPDSLVQAAIMWRTQRRLLRVHALIAVAKWQSGGRLPTSLAELPDEARLDPTTGVPYAYVVLSPAGYDLYSPGKDYSGDIRLKFNRADMPGID